MKLHGVVTGMATLTVLGTALTACGSGSDSKVSVDKLQQAADKAIAAPDTPCPLGFDINAALKKAGLTATATPAADPNAERPAVDAESATGAQDDAPLKTRGGALITCTYSLSGGGYVQAALTGVRNGTAITLMAPLLQHDGDLARSDLFSFIAQKLETGKAVLTPGPGLASITKVGASGGDALLEVTTAAADHTADHRPIIGEPLRELTEALAKQVRV
ncbi:hypothetical protein [Catenulispora subtropica]|uniref:hypothetical protein n=1 Tax=Catenulispora subtropica TaxID=450798 RepID=UPI0031D1B72A